jgi:hypothetical protein
MKKIAALASILLLVSCGDENHGTSIDSVRADSVKTTVTHDGNWRELTESWSASLNLRNASIMRSFYADSVFYYGDHLSADEVVHRQEEYFALNPDYKQKITEYIDEIQQPDGSWLIKIIKQVTAGGKTADYPASIVFAKAEGGIWKIVAESDDITDLNKARSMELSYSPVQVTVEGLLEENSATGTDAGHTRSGKSAPYCAVWSKNTLDVVATPEQEERGWITEKNIDHIQLHGHEEQIRKLLNHKVRITGKLEHATRVDHYTRVVMNVELIEEAL